MSDALAFEKVRIRIVRIIVIPNVFIPFISMNYGITVIITRWYLVKVGFPESETSQII